MAANTPVKEVGYLHRRTNDYGKVPGELMRDKTISHGAVRLYAYMHWRYGNNMQNFESQESIAEALGVTDRSIRNWLKELQAARWVIVIERKDKRNRHISNRYHVFEVQEECDEWRKRLKLDVPAPKTKKSRAGAGGKPTHKDKQAEPAADSPLEEAKEAPNTSGTQFPMGQRNSVSGGAGESQRNSVSDYPVTESYPVTLIYRGESAEPEPADVADRFRAIQATLVQKSFDGNPAQFGAAGDLAHLLLGSSEKKHLAQYNFDPPFTLAEFRAFEAWYDAKRDKTGAPLHWPINPAKLNQQAFMFRTCPEYAKYMRLVTEPPKPNEPTASEMAMARALDAMEADDERDTADTLAA